MIEAYADGGVSAKNQIGGWGVVLLLPDGERLGLKGFERGAHVTNNTMELTSAIEALKYCSHHHPGVSVTIVSDSEYVVKGASEWSRRWRMCNWKGVNGQVKNRPLWELLLSYTDRMKPAFRWVRGHDGQENNEIADRLAVSAYREQLTD